jgi:hypothetical protein
VARFYEGHVTLILAFATRANAIALEQIARLRSDPRR